MHNWIHAITHINTASCEAVAHIRRKDSDHGYRAPPLLTAVHTYVITAFLTSSAGCWRWFVPRRSSLGSQEPGQDSFLRVHSIGCLPDDNALRRIDDFVGDFLAPSSGQAVHEEGAFLGMGH